MRKRAREGEGRNKRDAAHGPATQPRLGALANVIGRAPGRTCLELAHRDSACHIDIASSRRDGPVAPWQSLR